MNRVVEELAAARPRVASGDVGVWLNSSALPEVTFKEHAGTFTGPWTSVHAGEWSFAAENEAGEPAITWDDALALVAIVRALEKRAAKREVRS